MNPDSTVPDPPKAPVVFESRIKPIALRLPVGLADRLREQSRLSGDSQNALIVQAVRQMLGEGGPATEERIADLEENVTKAVTLFAGAAGDIDKINGRLDALERLARQSGADF